MNSLQERLKDLSIIHVLKDRYGSKFRARNINGFLSFICSYPRLYPALHFTIGTISLIFALILGKGILWLCIVDIILYSVITLILAIIDTYNTFGYRLRQRIICIIDILLNIKK